MSPPALRPVPPPVPWQRYLLWALLIVVSVLSVLPLARLLQEAAAGSEGDGWRFDATTKLLTVQHQAGKVSILDAAAAETRTAPSAP